MKNGSLKVIALILQVGFHVMTTQRDVANDLTIGSTESIYVFMGRKTHDKGNKRTL